MEFLELAKKRYSVRKFINEPVPQECVDKILAAAMAAPTACNFQPQKILVINSPEGLEKLAKCSKFKFGQTLAFLLCYDKTVCWTRPFDGKKSGEVDSGIVGTHMILEAADLGIGSTWVMFFEPDKVRAEFELGDELEPAAILMMGIPADDAVPGPKHSESRELGDVVSYI